IGMGNMAQAIASGFISSGKIDGKDIFAYAPHQDKLQKNAERIGFTPCATQLEAIAQADTVLAACKPYQMEAVLAEIKDALKGKVLLSVVAGWNLKSFQDILGTDTRIQCIMPNTPAMVGEGVLLFESDHSLTAEEHEDTVHLFECLGVVEELPSHLMGIGGAISGCGPAFMDVFMEAYADAAVKYGIGRELAYRMVSQTMVGAAKLQQKTGSHPGVLKDAVCSPNGTTICGVDALEKHGVRGALISSIDAIMERKARK
ncbi:MAG: pyrroline-5-carboxylate reductase, partial [Treponemataceae bacterium]|nr:pyrroline-5-carboxylate reductase [Treponemataceae bacterium]